MGRQVIDVTVASEGDPESVYRLLADGSTGPEWSPVGSCTLLEPGRPDPDDPSAEGLGAVRLFTTGRVRSRERLALPAPAGEVHRADGGRTGRGGGPGPPAQSSPLRQAQPSPERAASSAAVVPSAPSSLT
jgi:hypothetical protein